MTENPVSYSDCLACAQQRLQPDCPFPPHLLAALYAANQPDDVVEGMRHTGYPVVRVSSLLGCKYKSWLGRTEGYPLETPREYWARLRGTLIHRAIEEMGLDAEGLTEKRLSAFLWDDVVAAFVTGRVDAYDVESRTLYDFKTVNINKQGLAGMTLPRPRHVKQLRIYSWLLVKNGYPPPTSIQIAYMSMADLRTEQAPVLTAAELNEIEGWIITIMRDILAKQAPEVKPVEGWECSFCAFTQCRKNRKNCQPKKKKAEEAQP